MSLLPICSKIFEKLTFDSIYEFIDKNNLYNSNQSGFRPNEFCIHQLISITHNTFSASDANPSLEVHDVFFSLIYLKHLIEFGMTVYFLYKLTESFLNNRCQRVVLNGQSSVWKSIIAGVPQGSILDPLFK